MGDVAPGFRFYPTEEELILFYLQNKLNGTMLQKIQRVIPVLYIYNFNPWDLPQHAGELCRGDTEQWFFFIPQPEREAQGGRPNRLTSLGYWKATGSPAWVFSSNNRVIGWRRSMVFYKGRAPAGKKTEWKMNEYLVIDGEASASTGAHPQLRQEFSLCRVYKNSKCLRSFDRRPPPAPTTAETMVGQGQQGGGVATSHQNHSTMERTSSSDTSFGDQAYSQATWGIEDLDMAFDNEPLWDWEQ